MKQTNTTAAENSRKHPASASNAPNQSITAPEPQTPPASRNPMAILKEAGAGKYFEGESVDEYMREVRGVRDDCASHERHVKTIYALYLEKLHAEAVAQLDYSYETEDDQHRAFSNAEMLDFMRRTGTAPERMADLIMTVAPDFYKACRFELVALDVLYKLFSHAEA